MLPSRTWYELNIPQRHLEVGVAFKPFGPDTFLKQRHDLHTLRADLCLLNGAVKQIAAIRRRSRVHVIQRAIGVKFHRRQPAICLSHVVTKMDI
jgi:hypothetical protein